MISRLKSSHDQLDAPGECCEIGISHGSTAVNPLFGIRESNKSAPFSFSCYRARPVTQRVRSGIRRLPIWSYFSTAPYRPLHARSKYRALVCLFLAVISVGVAKADDDQEHGLGRDYFVVDSISSVPFEPLWAFLVVTDPSAQVSVYPAHFTYLSRADLKRGDEQSASSVTELHVLSLVDRHLIEKLEKTSLMGIFLFEGEFGAINASPAFAVLKRRIAEATQNAMDLSETRKGLAVENQKVESQVLSLEDEIYSLIPKLEKTGNLSKTIEFRNRITAIQGESLVSEGEHLRLRRLIDKAMSSPPTEADRDLRRKMVLLLKEISEKTAIALRSGERREKEAKAFLAQKISVVNMYEGRDSESLLRTYLSLKSQREQLEARLGKRPSSNSDRDF